MKIILIPLGEVDHSIIAVLREKLAQVFGCAVELGQRINIPAAAWDKGREQYTASSILSALQKLYLERDEKLLAVADVDIFTENLSFIFGLADVKSGICLISLTRLRQENYGYTADEKLFNERVLKEAVHEIGHILGLQHCPDIKCVMHFSNSLQDTDIKGMAFCSKCQPKLII